MNNRIQQRMDRSIREAIAATQRVAELRHAEQQAHAEDRRRFPVHTVPLPPVKRTRKPKMRLKLDPLTGGTVLVPV